ncbi:HalOD1 output domain-containing protein [Halostella salina]|uniref:HalOD1 output domain-containing protein n=1 Tax=Halostella salina TaxID=1547897 RepID=UPI00196A0B07|nr:HalOD1 output domain-containing protein [Halostella salina]
MGMHSQEINPDESPSAAVVRAVAEVDGVDETELPTLQDAVDADALDDIAEDGVRVEFTYAGHDVVVVGEEVRVG